jgi:hypothetical protein
MQVDQHAISSTCPLVCYSHLCVCVLLLLLLVLVLLPMNVILSLLFWQCLLSMNM